MYFYATTARAILLVLSGTFAVACDDEAENHPATYECAWSFELSVRDGPSAPLAVSGPFALVQNADGTYDGGLVDGAGAYYAASGSVAGDGLELRFTMPDGRTVVGHGDALGDFADRCRDTFEGDLAGPEASDTGDWVSRSSGAPDPIASAVCDACLRASPSRPGLCDDCPVCAFQCKDGSAALQERYGVQ